MNHFEYGKLLPNKSFPKGLEHETNPTPRYLGGAQLKYVPKYGIKGV